MKHCASKRYWRLYEALPEDIRSLADKSYALLRSNPQHPSVQFKRIRSYWSVWVGLHHRALGLDVDGGILWFCIGTHAEYDRLLGA